jgi:LmbE family N-acetylglucosaminyl deacetylase
MSSNQVLVVGAHPDDIEIGCGGAIAKHLTLGEKVYAIVLTNGERGNHVEGRQECIASLKSLGIHDVFFGNFSDGFLKDDCNTVSFIENHIKKLGITRVYTHSPDDRHQDHRNCSRAVSSAARKISEILLFQGPSTTIFEPHYFIEISDKHLDMKLNAVKCYESQIKKGILNPRLLRNTAELHGSVCSKKYAEAFAINHVFKEGSHV